MADEMAELQTKLARLAAAGGSSQTHTPDSPIRCLSSSHSTSRNCGPDLHPLDGPRRPRETNQSVRQSKSIADDIIGGATYLAKQQETNPAYYLRLGCGPKAEKGFPSSSSFRIARKYARSFAASAPPSSSPQAFTSAASDPMYAETARGERLRSAPPSERGLRVPDERGQLERALLDRKIVDGFDFTHWDRLCPGRGGVSGTVEVWISHGDKWAIWYITESYYAVMSALALIHEFASPPRHTGIRSGQSIGSYVLYSSNYWGSGAGLVGEAQAANLSAKREHMKGSQAGSEFNRGQKH
ncbi:hypothetical protein B0H11DRAFT_2197525 [Mycena galericulata]|nr:hypothetical protein B0H11DRAFT_2197525 [Mycena galericulata]